MGTFSCFEDQVKLAEKFHHDNNKYNNFVKRQIHLINEIDDDKKVDYFASLTRCFLLTDLKENLFFKLSKYIINCTPEELQFLFEIPFDYQSKKHNFCVVSLSIRTFCSKGNARWSYLYFIRFRESTEKNSLNFNSELGDRDRIVSYEEMTPLNIAEPATAEDIEKIFNDSEIVIDGGSME